MGFFSKKEALEEVSAPGTFSFEKAPVAESPETRTQMRDAETPEGRPYAEQPSSKTQAKNFFFQNRLSAVLPVSLTQTPKGTSGKKQHSVFAQMWACASYGIVSVSLTITQKTVFHTYSFHYPNCVTLLQILTSLALMHVLRAFGKIEFIGFQWETAKKVFPLALAWWLYVVSGVTALRYLSVPMFSVLRRVTTILVVIGEYLMFSKVPTLGSGASLVMMSSGAALAGLGDVTFSLPGYVYISVCVVSTAVYLLLIRRLRDSTGLNETSLLYYNNILGLPLMVGWLYFGTDELSTVFQYEYITEPSFLGCLVLSASQAFVLNMCIFHCTSVNSPLATSVTGQIKDIATTGLGLVLFGDVFLTNMNIAGLSVGLLGGMMYSAISYVSMMKAAAAQKRDSTN